MPRFSLFKNDIFNAKELMYAMVRLFLRPSKSGVLKEHSIETDWSYITFNIYVNLKMSKAMLEFTSCRPQICKKMIFDFNVYLQYKYATLNHSDYWILHKQLKYRVKRSLSKYICIFVIFRTRCANIFQYLFRLLQLLSNAHSFRWKTNAIINWNLAKIVHNVLC